MKKPLIILISFIAFISVSAVSVVVHSTGISQYTNSPPDGLGDCLASGCHGGGTVAPVVIFKATPAFGTGNTYIPGVVYTLSYQVTGYSTFGFDLEILNGSTSSATDAGTWGAAVSNCQVIAATNYTTGVGSTKNVTHNKAIPSTSTATWKWTAPASGAVYIYSVGLGTPSAGGQNPSNLKQMNVILYPSPASIAEQSNLTTDFKLFPNPTSDNIHLTYSLNKRSDVSIVLYDMEGRMVANLLTQNQDSGEQNFDAYIPAYVGKGIYTVVMSVDKMPTVKKLMIK
jgi:hypothetical protein